MIQHSVIGVAVGVNVAVQILVRDRVCARVKAGDFFNHRHVRDAPDGHVSAIPKSRIGLGEGSRVGDGRTSLGHGRIVNRNHPEILDPVIIKWVAGIGVLCLPDEQLVFKKALGKSRPRWCNGVIDIPPIGIIPTSRLRLTTGPGGRDGCRAIDDGLVFSPTISLVCNRASVGPAGVYVDVAAVNHTPFERDGIARLQIHRARIADGFRITRGMLPGALRRRA